MDRLAFPPGPPHNRGRMPRLLSFAIFLLVALGVLGAVHYYLWARLVRDPALPGGWYRAFSGLLIVLYLSLPAAMLLARSVPRVVARALAYPAYIWLGTMFLLFVAVLATDVARWLGFAYERWASAPVDAERRLTLNRIFGFAALAFGAGSSGLALFHGQRFFVKRVEVPLSRLPQALDGLTIVQLSDVHIGPSLGREFIQDVVRTVNGLSPDLVAITGDLVDGSVGQLGSIVRELGELRSVHGTFFVTGNHEYYSGAQEWCDALSGFGVRVLRNERVSIGNHEHSFDLAGIDDAQADRFGNGHGADLPKALAGRDTSRELVLLAHQPKAVHDARQHGVGLQLSGHTHGGQVWPFSWLVKLQQPVVSGLELIEQTWVYVSNGTGYWGPPMRLGAPAEVTQIVLRRRPA